MDRSLKRHSRINRDSKRCSPDLDVCVALHHVHGPSLIHAPSNGIAFQLRRDGASSAADLRIPTRGQLCPRCRYASGNKGSRLTRLQRQLQTLVRPLEPPAQGTLEAGQRH
jgi:hypothetical protein